MSTEILKQALEKIARVNACDYEYQAWAREALNHIPDAKKMVQGEPVAWYDDIHQDFSRVQRIGWKPLVFADTTPQQRKPLRDEMLKQMKESCENDNMEMRGAFVDGWTSAEAAHGIKE